MSLHLLSVCFFSMYVVSFVSPFCFLWFSKKPQGSRRGFLCTGRSRSSQQVHKLHHNIYQNHINVWFPQKSFTLSLMSSMWMKMYLKRQPGRSSKQSKVQTRWATTKREQKKLKEEPTSRHSHTHTHTHTRTGMFCLTDAQSLTPIDEVSGGLFLTQMNSKSTKALGCFLRMLVVEVAYLLSDNIFPIERGSRQRQKNKQKKPMLSDIFSQSWKKRLKKRLRCFL